jgi:SHS2 domain-containing protein
MFRLMRFEYTEHTADLGFTAYGETLEDLFANAAEALFNVIVATETVRRHRKRIVKVKADALDELLVHWLNELLFLFETQALVFGKFEITFTGPTSLRAVAMGESLDLSRHQLKTGIKAVTYHQLFVGQNKGLWECHVILDL